MHPLPENSDALQHLIRQRLFERPPDAYGFKRNGDLKRISAVLFLLCAGPVAGEPMVIFNKRSQKVRQPGDLCCPGGGISPATDGRLARFMQLPLMPLARWPYRDWWRRHRRSDFAKLSLLLTTGLREGFEEMRLNPFGATFLGPMPVQHLVLFKRSIYPLVAWVNRQQRFSTNWEVESIVRIPLGDLLDPERYARYRISYADPENGGASAAQRDMRCFVHREHGRQELLWGATFRITMQFLKTVVGFEPPAPASLPVIRRHLGNRYLEGSRISASGGSGG